MRPLRENLRDELRAVLAAQTELPPDIVEEQLIETFLDRIEQEYSVGFFRRRLAVRLWRLEIGRALRSSRTKFKLLCLTGAGLAILVATLQSWPHSSYTTHYHRIAFVAPIPGQVLSTSDQRTWLSRTYQTYQQVRADAARQAQRGYQVDSITERENPRALRDGMPKYRVEYEWSTTSG